LESITYSFSGADPTVGGTDTSRAITWVATDGVASSNLATSTVDVAPCFCPGTLIRTDRGDVPVEALTTGDRVITASGTSRPIRWLGHRRLDLTRHPTPGRVRPIRIRANAFGEALPRRDLLL
jgi:hypothetical protein